MPTLDDIISVFKRQGLGRIGTILFGFCCLIVTNLFKSDPMVDFLGNLVFGGLIAMAIFGKRKEE
jgi:hypothetical protein